MTREDIELLFQSESYDEAMRLLRKELLEDSENAECFYYFFLAENGDYANINFEDVVCEFDFNRALDLWNRRLRDLFLSEYNFYKAIDPSLRKFFAYASRGNIDKFDQLLDTYEYKTVELIHDGSSTEDFLSNLDYLVTSRVKHEIVDLNILALNLLYLSTKNDKVLEIYKLLKTRAKEIGTVLANVPLANYLSEIKECINAIKKQNNSITFTKGNEVSKKKTSETLQDIKAEEVPLDLDVLEKNHDSSLIKEKLSLKEEKLKQTKPSNTKVSNEKTGIFKVKGVPIGVISLVFLIISIATFIIILCRHSNEQSSLMPLLMILNIALFLFSFNFILFTIAFRSIWNKERGGILSLLCLLVTIILSVIGFLVIITNL